MTDPSSSLTIRGIQVLCHFEGRVICLDALSMIGSVQGLGEACAAEERNGAVYWERVYVPPKPCASGVAEEGHISSQMERTKKCSQGSSYLSNSHWATLGNVAIIEKLGKSIVETVRTQSLQEQGIEEPMAARSKLEYMIDRQCHASGSKCPATRERLGESSRPRLLVVRGLKVGVTRNRSGLSLRLSPWPAKFSMYTSLLELDVALGTAIKHLQ
ncbi:hypothetical protein BJY52DRAFT_1418176 [Lactarius psammicola]|nr:hypothetical protein BJY52DRAFT_1418176 [Lactarius psammicola]